jgi:hypothetical protein
MKYYMKYYRKYYRKYRLILDELFQRFQLWYLFQKYIFFRVLQRVWLGRLYGRRVWRERFDEVDGLHRAALRLQLAWYVGCCTIPVVLYSLLYSLHSLYSLYSLLYSLYSLYSLHSLYSLFSLCNFPYRSNHQNTRVYNFGSRTNTSYFCVALPHRPTRMPRSLLTFFFLRYF